MSRPRKFDPRDIALAAIGCRSIDAVAAKVGCCVATARRAMLEARDNIAPPAPLAAAHESHRSAAAPMDPFTLYAGPSMLDGAPIVCLVLNPYQVRVNAKTEGLVQTYIFRADVPPLDAIASGADASVCGGCRHRGRPAEGGGMVGRSCYVQLWGGPRNVWLAHERGKYPFLPAHEARARLAGRVVRLGSYGDPAAVPAIAWRRVLGDVEACVGYTHQWRHGDQELARWCMASVDDEIERAAAQAMGWRTFRVRAAGAPRHPDEVVCPASAEAGKRTNCSECRACGGHSAKARAHIVINAHGDPGKVRAFEREAFLREREAAR